MNSRYNLVIDCGEVIIFEGTFCKTKDDYDGSGKPEYCCIITDDEAYNQYGRITDHVLYVYSKPTKIAKETFDSLKSNIEKIMKLAKIYIVTCETLLGQKLRGRYKTQF